MGPSNPEVQGLWGDLLPRGLIMVYGTFQIIIRFFKSSIKNEDQETNRP